MGFAVRERLDAACCMHIQVIPTGLFLNRKFQHADSSPSRLSIVVTSINGQLTSMGPAKHPHPRTASFAAFLLVAPSRFVHVHVHVWREACRCV